jgi:hypothetical protein
MTPPTIGIFFLVSVALVVAIAFAVGRANRRAEERRRRLWDREGDGRG